MSGRHGHDHEDPSAPGGPREDERPAWNHNIAYYDRLLEALPEGCDRVLDVGCGEGRLTHALAERGVAVVALDVNPDSVTSTRTLVTGQDRVEVVEGDVMDPELELGIFDAVLTVAALHHLPLEDGLRRLSMLVAPGGVLGVIGLAQSRSLWDLAHDAVGFVATRVLRRRRQVVEVRAPIVVPRTSYSRVLRVATLMLPGVRYRRHVLFRYSLVWTRPG